METGSADFCDLAKATRDMDSAICTLRDLVDETAKAKVVKESHGERAKQALHKAMAKAGADSMAKAEVMARVDPAYLAQFDLLMGDLEIAEKALLRWSVLQTRIDGLRTKISLQKETLKNL
jgi:hypothetical protein